MSRAVYVAFIGMKGIISTDIRYSCRREGLPKMYLRSFRLLLAYTMQNSLIIHFLPI
jgi:hypothetical protein